MPEHCFQIRVDLLNDCMASVSFVCSDGVQVTGGEQPVESVQVEQARLVEVVLVQLRKVSLILVCQFA